MSETIINTKIMPIELKIHTKDLMKALSYASSVAEKKNVLAELSNIKLEVCDNLLILGATDMDLYLKQNLGVEVTSSGETTISTRVFSDIVRKIPDEIITLHQDMEANKLHIISDSCSFELLTLPAQQFPTLDDINAEFNIELPLAEFAKILEYTHFSMSNEETRYTLNGIYLHLEDGKLFGAATDGHRMSSASSINEFNQTSNFGAIIPRKTVLELLKICRDNRNSEGNIIISVALNKIKFEYKNILLISKLIDGNFPEYNALIPKNNPYSLVINAKILANSIDRIAIITSEKFRVIKLACTKDGLEITAHGEARGSGVEEILPSEDDSLYYKYSGEDVSIGFNPSYLSDVLNAIDDELIELNLIDHLSPILLKSTTKDHDRFVIMPVKV